MIDGNGPGQPAHLEDLAAAPPPLLLEMAGICKAFGRQRVLEDVHFDLRAGEVHVLAGENGAGKSTLMRILGGALQPDAGEVRIDGRPVGLRSPRDAAAAGVAIIHQELSLVGPLPVMDNVLLGREPSRAGWLSRRRVHREATRLLEALGLHDDVRRPVEELSLAERQAIEIAKALALDARIIVMDEPTSALNGPEADRLFDRVADLASRGRGIVYITHRLEEIYRLADRITVLRDGRNVVTAPAAELAESELVRSMIGRDLAARPVPRGAAPGPVRLAVEHFTVAAHEAGRPPLVDDVSFELRAGEILGIAGLAGSGAADLLRALFGAQRTRVSGRIAVDGRTVRIRSPRDAIARGIGLLTGDRQRTGLVAGLDVAANVTLASLRRVSPGGWLSRRHETERAAAFTRSLNLGPVSLRQPVATLSGGNQQKVVLAKWLSAEPRLLLLDEPARGVDVGARREIDRLIGDWCGQGHAALLLNSELPELLRMADRIMVMHRGRVTGTFGRAEAAPQRVLAAAMGGGARD